jgi:hypothetical protein
MSKSERARFRGQQALEEEAARQGLCGLASETSGACWQCHQCRTPARLGAQRSSTSRQGGDARPRDTMPE